MLKNIIKIPHTGAPDDYIIRQTIYILYLILLAVGGALALLLMSLYRSSGIIVAWEETTLLGSFLGGTIGILVILGQLAIRGFIIGKLVNYFYTFTVLEGEKVMHFRYSLFFEEDVQIVELYRVLTIQATQTGIFESFCNFGDIELQMQNDMCLVITNIPKPKLVVSRIEKLKEYIVERREKIGESATNHDGRTSQHSDQSKEDSSPNEDPDKTNQDDEHIKEEIKQEIEEEIREEVKEEIREEVKKEVKKKIKQDMHQQIKEDLQNKQKTKTNQ